MKPTMDNDLPPLPTIPLGRYRHYKGGEYEVLGVVRHSESLEPLVLYRPLYNQSGSWVRPFSMFLEPVEHGGKTQPRFARVAASSSVTDEGLAAAQAEGEPEPLSGKGLDMHQHVLSFWFEELQSAQWWRVDPALDALIRDRFGKLLLAARAGELADWRSTPEGRLAEIIVLDQFSRNTHRGTADAFAADDMALALAQEAVSIGADQSLLSDRRAFVYMPFMHSESLAAHERAVHLFSDPSLPEYLKAELRHKAIIDRFGRYPHRNIILGRKSTPEEETFLQEPGSSF